MAKQKRIFITGGTGFIGRHILAALQKSGEWHEIHALRRASSQRAPDLDGIIWHEGDLLEPPMADALIDQIKPSHLIHAAWVTEHGAFWTHPDNAPWLDASLRLADAFARHGGQRFIQLGTVAEYDWQSGRMIEGVTPEQPATPYGEAKLAFHRALVKLTLNGRFSAATARVFFVYGAHEQPGRLIPTACRALITRQPEAFGSLNQWRDFLHVTDLARGIAALTQSSLEGAVNIGSGGPVRLSLLLDTLERLTGQKDVFQRGARTDPSGEPPILFADVGRLAKTGWLPLVTYEEGLTNALDYWRGELAR